VKVAIGIYQHMSVSFFFIPLRFSFPDFCIKTKKAKNAFLVSRIGMALRPLRPKDTANIKKKSNFPNYQPEKFNAEFGFNDPSLVIGA